MSAKFNIAKASSPEDVQVVESADGSVEEAIRIYNGSREPVMTAKKLIITPYVEPVAEKVAEPTVKK